MKPRSCCVSLFRQDKRRVEGELYRWGVLRYGWREEDLEGVPGVKVSMLRPLK